MIPYVKSVYPKYDQAAYPITDADAVSTADVVFPGIQLYRYWAAVCLLAITGALIQSFIGDNEINMLVCPLIGFIKGVGIPAAAIYLPK